MANEAYDNFVGVPKEKKHFGNPGGRKAQNGGVAANFAMPERSANWPGLPGKAQPRSRDAGVKRLKTQTKVVGL